MASKTHINRGSKKAQGIASPLTKRLFTLKEAGIYLGRSEYSVRSLIWNGVLPVVKHGKKQWLDLDDMNHYIEANKETVV
jgi:hypothetical protein